MAPANLIAALRSGAPPTWQNIYEPEGVLLTDRLNEDAVRLLWQTLPNTAQSSRAHPGVPVGAREALAAAGGCDERPASGAS